MNKLTLSEDERNALDTLLIFNQKIYSLYQQAIQLEIALKTQTKEYKTIIEYLYMVEETELKLRHDLLLSKTGDRLEIMKRALLVSMKISEDTNLVEYAITKPVDSNDIPLKLAMYIEFLNIKENIELLGEIYEQCLQTAPNIPSAFVGALLSEDLTPILMFMIKNKIFSSAQILLHQKSTSECDEKVLKEYHEKGQSLVFLSKAKVNLDNSTVVQEIIDNVMDEDFYDNGYLIYFSKYLTISSNAETIFEILYKEAIMNCMSKSFLEFLITQPIIPLQLKELISCKLAESEYHI